MLRTALLVASKDLRQRLRDRSALVIAFIAPFVLASIIGLAFGDAGSQRLPVGVADEGTGRLEASCGPSWRPPRPWTPAATRTPTPSARRCAGGSWPPGWSCPPATTRPCGPAARPTCAS